MKKSLSLLLALLMLFTALPLSAYAASGEAPAAVGAEETVAATGDDTVINEVYIVSDAAPKAGYTPHGMANILPASQQSKYTCNGAIWRNMSNNNSILSSTYTFSSNCIYSLEVTLEAKSGYVFDEYEENIGAHLFGTSSLPNYVVQNTGIKSLYHKRIIVYYIFRMSVSDTTSCIIKFYPNGGFGYKKPVAVPFNEGYTLPENSPTGDGFDPPYGGTFEKWKYCYASSGTSLNTGAPGKRLKVSQDLNMKAQWTMSPMVDTISISGLASPAWKTSPDYSVTVTGSNYMLNRAYDDNDYIINGVEWRDYNHNKVPHNLGFSNSDKQFYVTFYLKTVGDYIFNKTDKLTVLVNGRKANAELDATAEATSPGSGKYLKVTFGYLATVYFANVDIPEPVAYQKLSLTADVRGLAKQNTSRNTDSYHNGICWTDETNYPGYILPADSIALPGHKYQALVSIIPKSNYEFAVKSDLHTYLPDLTVNGETVTQLGGYSGYYDYIGDGIRGEDECYVYKKFTTAVVDTNTVLEQAGVSVTAPAVGQSPVYQATVGEKGYKVKKVEWYNTTTGATVTTAQKFAAGGKYTVRVTLTADEGNRFDYSGSSYTTPVYVNGNKGYSGAFTNVFEITACYDFPALAQPTHELSGTFTSFLNDQGIVTFELLQSGTVKYSTSAAGNTGKYKLVNVANGEYTLRVSKKNHATRTYTITVNGDTTKNVKIHPLGDIDGDGKCNAKDYGMASAHAQKVSFLTGYQLACGDVVKNDGKITAPDAARIGSHAQKVDLMW